MNLEVERGHASLCVFLLHFLIYEGARSLSCSGAEELVVKIDSRGREVYRCWILQLRDCIEQRVKSSANSPPHHGRQNEIQLGNQCESVLIVALQYLYRTSELQECQR